MDSFDSFISVLWVLLILFLLIAVGLYAASSQLRWAQRFGRMPRIFVALALAFVSAGPLLTIALSGLHTYVDYWRDQTCAVIPPPVVNVKQPIVAPIPRMVAFRDTSVRRLIVEALSGTEPKWPYIDPSSDELDLPKTMVITMGDAPTPASTPDAEPLSANTVLLGRERGIREKHTAALYISLVDEYDLTDDDTKKVLASQRVPVGASLLGYDSYCTPDYAPSPTAINAIVRMTRATLRPADPATSKPDRVITQ